VKVGSGFPESHDERQCVLTFYVSLGAAQPETDVAPPYQVFSQIVNTDESARAAHDLRGRFEDGFAEMRGLIKKESTKYPGSHSIVKNGYCLAKTGPFIINIAEAGGIRRI
jgi:adenylyl/guanylyl cyclase-like protein with sensor domain